MKPLKKHLRRFVPVIGFVLVIWIVALANMALDDALCIYGLVPRSLPGLDGILFAPFLHADMGHVITNTASLLLLGALICVNGETRFLVATAIIIVISGLGVWVIGRDAIHFGASGVVFGYLGFLVARMVHPHSWESHRCHHHHFSLCHCSVGCVASGSIHFLGNPPMWSARRYPGRTAAINKK